MFTTSDLYLYTRYHHFFNKGEFTEVACVKGMNDPAYREKVHQDSLDANSKYQLTTSHGALPVCTLTLAMSIRQAMMIVTGFFCADLARFLYGEKVNEVKLCADLVSVTMTAKFTFGKDEDKGNLIGACFGRTLKLTGPVFSKVGWTGTNLKALESMEWLRADDTRLPEYIRSSLDIIGDTRKQVTKVMQDVGVNYNRVLFTGVQGPMKFTSVFANPEYMIHAPMLAYTSMRIFAGNSSTYASVKLCKQGCLYPVKVFSNSCIDTQVYTHRAGDDYLTSEIESSIEATLELIKTEVSCLLPTIDLKRIRMLAQELTEDEFSELLAAVKKSKIEVIGHEERSYPSTSSLRSAEDEVSTEQSLGTKRAREEEADCGPVKNIPRFDSSITLCESDAEIDLNYESE
ncbi:hypothetical protein KUCAC02_033054 [Chaenocephalus aceratus]|nr:hypothetical protein KUCAC02_033054 [Chaenocephalus aceratus]